MGVKRVILSVMGTSSSMVRYLFLRVARTIFLQPKNIGRQQLTTTTHTLLLEQSNMRQCWQHYCMQHARVGVVSAIKIVSGAQTLLFPANAPVGQETWSPGERWPSWRAVLYSGRHHESRACTAQVLDDHGTVKVQRLSRTHVCPLEC